MPANTGEARAIHHGVGLAGKPAGVAILDGGDNAETAGAALRPDRDTRPLLHMWRRALEGLRHLALGQATVDIGDYFR